MVSIRGALKGGLGISVSPALQTMALSETKPIQFATLF